MEYNPRLAVFLGLGLLVLGNIIILTIPETLGLRVSPKFRLMSITETLRNVILLLDLLTGRNIGFPIYVMY